MEIKKANDIFVATINNPEATTYDLTSLQLTPENTSLYTKEEYKSSKLVQDKFKTPEGEFDDIAFNHAFDKAASHYSEMTDDDYLKGLNTVMYSPFDVTRPKNAETFKVEVEFSKDYNPFKQLYSRTGINSIDENPLSLRELAQREKVFDPTTKTWSDQSANDMGILNKFFGDTLVYAQWEEEGSHTDPETGRTIVHRKGDWKINENGNLFLEKLGNREIYGKQVVNSMDLLTTDGTVANQFDFFDSDSKEKSALKTTLKIAAEIAPYLIPGFNTYYGGVNAALGLASVMPTFYKSIEGLLLGDSKSGLTDVATAAEGYMAKFTASSFSDEAQESMFNYEQMGTMVSQIFSQIYEQRAMASLSKYMMKSPINMAAKEQEYAKEINKNILGAAGAGKIDMNNVDEIMSIRNAAISKIPELASFQKTQSNLAKSLSLGYMALTSTSDIYGQAIEGGYDRRTAGFASLAAAAGQYGIMVNNRMGDWFLDKTTGYTTETNKALIRKSVTEYLDPIKNAFKTYGTDAAKGKIELAGAFKGIKNRMYDIFTSPSELGEALFKNAFIEGVEEVTEQGVLDATKGIIDTLSYLGMTKKEGSFGGFDNVFSQAGLENYVANFVGGVIGGAMFELNTRKLEPLMSGKKLNEDTKKSVYHLVGNGQTQLVIDEINKQRYKLGNTYLASPTDPNGTPTAATTKSQADAIADSAIAMVRNIDGIMNVKGLVLTDSEIIKKAMIDHMIIKDLEASKDENKIGIEGLVVDDFRNIASKITDLQTEMQKLTGTDADKATNKEAIAELTGQSLKLENELKDILEGKHAEKYYTQATFYLSKDISEAWMALDKNVYTKAKYNKEFKDIPVTGLGLTQEKVTKEWTEALESKNLRKYISTVTEAYLQLEKEVNPVIDNYVSTGYSAEAAKTYKDLIDLDSTIKMFNTATTPEKRQELLDRFTFINNELKKNPNTKLNILPWDVYKGDFAKNLIQHGMVGKYKLDEKGEVMVDENLRPISTNLTEADLDEKNEAGIRYGDTLEKSLNILLSETPINPLDIDGTSNILNAMLASSNRRIDTEMLKISSKGELTPEDETAIRELNAAKHNFVLLPFNNSPEMLKKKEELDLKIVNMFNDLENDKQISQAIVEAYKANNYYDLSNDTLKDEYASLAWLINLPQNELTEEYIKNLTPEQVESFMSSTLGQSTNQNKDLYNRIIEAKAKINTGSVIENNVDALEDFIETEKDLIDGFVSDVEAAKPAIFKMRNYALDLLLDQLKGSQGNPVNLDREVRIAAEKMVNTLTDSYRTQFFGDLMFDSIEDLMYFMTNAKELDAKISASKSINKLVEDEEDPTMMNLILDHSKAALDAENFGEPFSKYISINANINSNLLLAIHKLANFKGELNGFDQVNSFLELKQKGFKDIANPLYNFLKNFELSLQQKINPNAPTVFSILEREEKALLSAADINNFLTEGIKLTDLQNAINVIKLVRSSVFAMSTTEVSFEQPYGFIASRQAFVAKNHLESETGNLKTVSSDVATLMIQDLDRLQVKLQFYYDLAKSNSARVFNEQDTIRVKMVDILRSKISELTKFSSFAPIKTQIDAIEADKNKSPEKKLMEIEALIFETFHGKDKKALLQELLKNSKIEIDARKLSKLSKDVVKEDITNYDFAMYLVTVLSVHSKDFNAKMHGLLSEFDKAPFFTQELAMRTAYASIIDPDLFSTVIELDEVSIEKNTTNLITYVLGGGGTGKTTVIFKMLLKYLQKNNPSIDLWLIGPEQSQADKLTQDVLKDVNFVGAQMAQSKLSFYERVGIKDEMAAILADLTAGKDDSAYYKWIDNKLISINEDTLNLILSKAFKDGQGNVLANLPNMIFIDEITHFSSLELDILNKIVQSLPKDNFIKIIGAGDTSQSGFKYGGTMELNVDRVKGIFTPKLLVTIRAANIWKRENNDLVTTLSEKITDKFNDADLAKDSARDAESEATDLLDTYKTQRLFDLKYHKSDTILNGDIIVDKLNDSIVSTLKNAMAAPLKEGESDKTIGILTDSGSYEEYREALVAMGLLTPDGVLNDRVKIFTLGSIQGNEVDYFIFDTKLIKSDKVHHKLKDFYTYISRAKDATIIVDTSNFKEKFGILNTSQVGTDIREPLSAALITKAREQRIETLNGLLDGQFNVKFDRFMFSGDSPLDSEDTVDSVLTEKDVASFPFNPMSSVAVKVEDDYKYMFHTFYNNPNTKVTPILDKNGNMVDATVEKISYSKANTNSDLNIDKVTKEQTPAILNGWLSVKNYYTYNKQLPKDSESLKFLQAIFGADASADKVSTETVITASKYNDAVNVPINKAGFDLTKTLNTGDIFVNVALKLEYNGRVHYVTLATLSANTIKNAFGDESKSFLAYEAKMKELKAADIKGIVVLEDNVDFNNQITSVRFLSDVKRVTTVKDFKDTFKGIHKGKLKFFPTDEQKFRELLDRYNFNGKRALEDIVENGHTTPGIKTLFARYKGKPYMAVSYNSEDLEGSLTKDVQAKLVPLFTAKRSFDTAKKEISLLRDIYFADRPKKGEDVKIEDKYTSEEKGRITQLFKNTVSTTQLIKILIQVSEQYPEVFDALITPKGTFKVAPLDAIKKIVAEDKQDNVKMQITKVFSTIKSLRGKKSAEEIRKEVWPLLVDNAWKNYIANLLVLDELVTSDRNHAKEKEVKAVYDEMLVDIGHFHASMKSVLGGEEMHWEAPKKRGEVFSTFVELPTSDLDRKLQPYQPESYLYMNTIPESPRFLVNLENTFTGTTTPAAMEVEPAKTTAKKETQVTPQPTQPAPPPANLGVLRNTFSPLISLYAGMESSNPLKWRGELVSLFDSLTDSQINASPELQALRHLLGEDTPSEMTYEGFKDKLMGEFNIPMPPKAAVAIKNAKIIERLAALTGKTVDAVRQVIVNQNKLNSCK